MQEFVTVVPHTFLSLANGNLGIIDFANLPFEPKRIYWLSAVDDHKSRGHHAHKKLRQYFVAVQGSVDVYLTDTVGELSVTLCADGTGILLAPGLWREITNFSESAVLLVICDQPYSENDYIRDFSEYLDWIQK